MWGTSSEEIPWEEWLLPFSLMGPLTQLQHGRQLQLSEARKRELCDQVKVRFSFLVLT